MFTFNILNGPFLLPQREIIWFQNCKLLQETCIKVHQQRAQTSKTGETTNNIVIVSPWNKHLVIFKDTKRKLLSILLEQFLWVVCLHKFIRYQTLDLSHVEHAYRPKLVCTNQPYVLRAVSLFSLPSRNYWVLFMAR